MAYITLVAPAEILLFVERQLSDEGALAAGRHLALAIDVTNVMQTVRHLTARFTEKGNGKWATGTMGNGKLGNGKM